MNRCNETRNMIYFEYRNPSRQMTREEWKKANHWLRSCKRIIAERLGKVDFGAYFTDLAVFGEGRLSIDGDGIRHIPLQLK